MTGQRRGNQHLPPQTHEYFRSLSAELDVQADRVRSLIGGSHWASDGGHKEALLRGLIEGVMPSGTVVARGFLVNPITPADCSREQDVVVIDTSSEPPLFNYGGLVITSSEQAYACLSVKSAFGKQEFLDSLDGFLSVPKNTTCDTFFGSYHYGYDQGALSDLGKKLTRWLKAPRNRVPMVVRVSPSTFFLLETTSRSHRIRLYSTEGASTAFFVARLVNHIAAIRSNRPSAFADALDASDACSDCHEVKLP